MNTTIVRPNAVLSLTAEADLSTKGGCFVGISDTAGAIAYVSPNAFGVLLTEGVIGDKVSVAIGAGGLAGTVRVKLGGTVAAGALIAVNSSGLAITDAGTGARLIVGQAVEFGVSGELIEAVLFRPDART